MIQKILVVGGAGYIGSHVQKQLLEEGFEVVVYDNLSTGHRQNILSGAQFIEGDILDKKLLFSVMRQNIDGVIHLAAKKAVGESMKQPGLYAENNISGSLNILEAMVNAEVRHIVFSSSAAVYGMPKYLPLDENHPLQPINYYGYTKMAIEQNMEWFARLGKLNYASLRYFNAVGYAADKSITGKEKQPQNLMPVIMEVLTGKREKLSIYGHDYDTPDGTCVRDYIHVSDLATAHTAALRKLFAQQDSLVLNLGTGKGISVKEIVEATEKVCRQKLNYEYADKRPGDPAILMADAHKAQTVLNWKPQYTNIEDIVRTVWNLEI